MSLSRLGDYLDQMLTAANDARHEVRRNEVAFVSREGPTLLVRGLDCLDGAPLIDLKPDRCLFTPLAPPQPGDFETG
jgi:hypothetical protein